MRWGYRRDDGREGDGHGDVVRLFSVEIVNWLCNSVGLYGSNLFLYFIPIFNPNIANPTTI